MLEKLWQILNELDEAIEYSEELDHAHTTYYRSLIRKRRAIEKAIKKFEKADRGLRRR